MEAQPYQERRSEQRYPIDSINLPFIGTRDADHLAFQYLLIDISIHGAQIAIPRWLVGRERLQYDDVVNFHVPFRLIKETYDQGKVVWQRWDSNIEGQVCGVQMINRAPPHYPFYIAMESNGIGIDLTRFQTFENLLQRVIKDSVLLKKGVIIYLRHLIPYFSRISDYPSHDYQALKDVLLNEVMERVMQSQEWLENLYKDVTNTPEYQTHIARYLDLEDLRGVIESELYFELFKTVFSAGAALAYLAAIKQLEKKLYANYNTIVLMYLQSL